jgi:1-acyl-sn-glycerol-3-phosphate acyltransferase
MIAFFRALLRFLFFLSSASLFLIPITVLLFISERNMPLILRIRRKWTHLYCWVTGVRLTKNQAPEVKGPCVYVSNHRSYFDPIATLTEVEAMPVAKAEVKSWPFIGFATRATGVLFVKREDKASRHAVLDTMANELEKGHSVLIYPEGTTHLNHTTIDFKYGSFRLAAFKEVPVVPVAVHYGREEDAWIHNETFLPHYFKIFGRPHLKVEVRFGPPIKGTEFLPLLEQSKAWIDTQMLAMR